MSKNDFVGIDSVHMKYKKKKLKPLAPYIALTLTVPNFFIGTCSHNLIFSNFVSQRWPGDTPDIIVVFFSKTTALLISMAY